MGNTVPYSGDVESVKLVHTSGGVACWTTVSNTPTNWGCHVGTSVTHADKNGDNFQVQLVRHKDDFTVVDTVLPTASTTHVNSLNEFEMSCSAGCSVRSYLMDGVDA